MREISQQTSEEREAMTELARAAARVLALEKAREQRRRGAVRESNRSFSAEREGGNDGR
jgi:hypothetical protein